jgi:hypothetical protein
VDLGKVWRNSTVSWRIRMRPSQVWRESKAREKNYKETIDLRQGPNFREAAMVYYHLYPLNGPLLLSVAAFTGG